MSIAANLNHILRHGAVILAAAGTIIPPLVGRANVLQSFDGLGDAAGRVVPWFDVKPIICEGIASLTSSITTLKAPEPAIPIAHLHLRITL
jgi:hypothetical protein